VSASPLDALTELGSSLRPVSEVVYWRATGDQFIDGASYWAPFDRALAKIIPGRGWKLPPAEADPRVLGSLATMRGDGAIGFSVVAEAYRNFGPAGVCAIMALIGLLLGRLDLWPPTAGRQAMLGVLLVPLLVEVRNDFTAIPFQILEGCVVVYVVLAIARTIAHARR
ncbi:MAG: O-antigen polysaccharide polymerase Wzy family protein, partial [Chloroflexi bacterium]|nr:O-antigen polysaccharide polymerase Wzy family protein [Chloroflexota bacterium]